MVGKILQFIFIVLPFLVVVPWTLYIVVRALVQAIEEQQYTNDPILFHATVVKTIAKHAWDEFVSVPLFRDDVILFLVCILLFRLFSTQIATIPAQPTALIAMVDLLAWNIPGATTQVFQVAWMVWKTLQFIFVVFPFLVTSTWTLYIVLCGIYETIRETNYMNGHFRFLMTLCTRVSSRWRNEFVFEPWFRDHVLLFMASILLFLLHGSNIMVN
jgi:hypothetical protein